MDGLSANMPAKDLILVIYADQSNFLFRISFVSFLRMNYMCYSAVLFLCSLFVFGCKTGKLGLSLAYRASFYRHRTVGVYWWFFIFTDNN